MPDIRKTIFVIALIISIAWSGNANLGAQSYQHPNFIVTDIVVSGNKITRERIITRELTFKVGDTIPEIDLNQKLRVSKENVTNLSLFNFVHMDTVSTPTKDNMYRALKVLFNVEEEWYIWSYFNFNFADRNVSNWLKDPDLDKVTFEIGPLIKNFLGLNNSLKLVGRFGYQKGFRIGYDNIDLGRSGKHSLGYRFQMSKSHKINCITEDNDISARNSDLTMEQSLITSLSYYYKPTRRQTHETQFSYEYTEIADTVLSINPNYWGSDNLHQHALRLNYSFTEDQRDYHPYPLNGNMYKFFANTFAANSFDLMYMQLGFMVQSCKPIYNRLYGSTILFGGYSIKNKNAWILDRAIGHETLFLRGYEYYVADGQMYAASKNTLRYELLPTHVFRLGKWGGLKKFNKIHIALYTTLFFDMGYAHNKYHTGNTLENKFLYSYGVGLDLVTYYNIVISLNYARNRENEQGIFFSYKLPFN